MADDHLGLYGLIGLFAFMGFLAYLAWRNNQPIASPAPVVTVSTKQLKEYGVI